MLKHLLKRLVMMAIVLWLLITISFIMMRMTPGSPFSMEKHVDEAIRKNMEKHYGLDQPLSVQYIHLLKNLVFKGDLGPSLKHKAMSVNEIIARGLPVSFVLGLLSILLALGFGLCAGYLSALKHLSLWDYGSMGFCLLGLSIPVFVIAPLFQFIFSIQLEWFPLAEFKGFQAWEYLVLPALTLSLPFAARIARLARAGLLEVLTQDYIRTAKAKGFGPWQILTKHALKPSLIPVVSFLGPAIAQITTGTLVIEKIFSIPGLGRDFILAAIARDYPLVMGTVIVYGFFIIIFNFLSDVIHALLDPRVREGYVE